MLPLSVNVITVITTKSATAAKQNKNNENLPDNIYDTSQ